MQDASGSHAVASGSPASCAARAVERKHAPTGVTDRATSAASATPGADGNVRGVSDLTRADIERLAGIGIPEDEASRQLALLRRPGRFLFIDRPCTVGDGIERLSADDVARCVRVHDAAAAEGLVSGFVPASGAASRMFRELMACRGSAAARGREGLNARVAAGDSDARVLHAFLDGLPKFAFHGELARAVERRGGAIDRLAATGPYDPILDALLGPNDLNYGALPKGLVAFHRYGDDVRAAFDEHLVDAARLFRGARGDCHVHFTVSDDHLTRFGERLAEVRPGLEARLGAILDVTFSVQDPATDTLAIGGDGAPARNGDGSLLLRPAGHGALVRNLVAVQTSVAFVRNVDNVAAEPFRAPAVEYARVLVGRLCELRERATELIARIDAGDDAAADEAVAFVRGPLGRDVPDMAREPSDERRARARDQLHRPMRVCGMVLNTGEPGGGPFWVRGANGERTRQIVESAEIDMKDAETAAKVRASTHFNPVFMACALRDSRGKAFDLEPYIDPDAVIVTRRSAQGKDLVALERPGLWNGAMARWNTVFVEVPLDVFHPVKTVLDLLRPEHQSR
jgi:Domain of unknown function (DUF4301)